MKLNTELTNKHKTLTHACKNMERVRAAMAALTIMTARSASIPMFPARPAINRVASSPPTPTNEELPVKLCHYAYSQ